MFTRLVIEAKFLRVYTCCRCGRVQEGTTERISVDTGGVQKYTLDADTIPRRGHDMPVGWSSNPDGFRCQGCT